MKKYIDKVAIITTLVCLLPMILGFLFYSKLPQMIPTHFDFSGNINGYSSRNMFCFGLPVLLASVNLFLHFMLNNDPKKANISNKMKAISKWSIPLISIILIPSSYFIAMGYQIPITRISIIFVGTLILITGNYLPKSRQNFTTGIKLPWTLSSEENWNKTHRLAGFIWIVGGNLILFSGIFNFFVLPIFIVSMTLMTIVPMVYSFILYRKENK